MFYKTPVKIFLKTGGPKKGLPQQQEKSKMGLNANIGALGPGGCPVPDDKYEKERTIRERLARGEVMTQGATPAPTMITVDDVLSGILDYLGCLEASAEQLEARLSPITLPEEDRPSTKEENPLDRCPLARELLIVRNRIGALRARLDSLTERVGL